MTGLLLVPLLLQAVTANDYATAEVCRQCHRERFETQSQSAHAQALKPSVLGQPGDWAFGAGTQAITFVSRVDRQSYQEHGETWYRSLNGYGTTPGHAGRAGMQFRIFEPSARVLRCFACHSTGPLTLDANDRIVPHELGVRCEACHGPAAAHARDPIHIHPRNPARMSAAGMNQFCGNCHRVTGVNGEDNTDLRDPMNVRAQPLRLAASACFLKSKGQLTCLTCHSPHEPLERRGAVYDSACQKCHTATVHTRPIAGHPCAECHMPALAQGDLVFVNHRIGVYGARDPLTPVTLPAINAPKPRP